MQNIKDKNLFVRYKTVCEVSDMRIDQQIMSPAQIVTILNRQFYAKPENIWKEKIVRVMDFLYSAARTLGGNVSGEHGIGHAKRPYLLGSVGERQMTLMRGIKAAFDPNCILNPGKVIL